MGIGANEGGPPRSDACYQPGASWTELGLELDGDTPSVAVAPDDSVWVFHRGIDPVVHLDRDGSVLARWGGDEFVRPHGITIDRFGDVYLVDELAHTVEKRAPDGTLLLRLGTPGVPVAAHSGGTFNRPTAVAIDPNNGDLFVSDGYANSAIHRFRRDGEHLLSWGAPGSRIGCFSLPHHIAFLDADLLVVSDRENFRLQYFDRLGIAKGHLHCHRPCAAVPFDYDGETLLLIAELGASGIQRDVPGLGRRIVAVDARGMERLSFEGPTEAPLVAPHDIAVDSNGCVYIAEVAMSWLRYAYDQTPEEPPASLSRWVPAPSPPRAR